MNTRELKWKMLSFIYVSVGESGKSEYAEEGEHIDIKFRRRESGKGKKF